MHPAAWVLFLVVAQKPVLVPGDTFEKTNKPSGLMPEHSASTVAKRGRIHFVSIAAWEKLFSVEPRTRDACVSVPIAELKATLESKTLPPADRELAVAGCPDAGAYFTLHARPVRFKGGRGILYVTQFFIESVLTSNDGLEAHFQGLSDDGKIWIGGSIPVSAKGLRKDGGDLQIDMKAYRDQLAADAAFLSKLKASDFTPNLDDLAAELAKLQLP